MPTPATATRYARRDGRRVSSSSVSVSSAPQTGGTGAVAQLLGEELLIFIFTLSLCLRNPSLSPSQRRLGDAAKKAISKLQVRTIRKGDQETEADFDNCAVCIEGYRANDVVRILPCR